MFDKEKAAVIKHMNEALGMFHRSKPYDVKNPEDLKHALLLSISAYKDYQHYYYELTDLGEKFDESLEYYDPASWFFLTVDAEKVETDAYKADRYLDNARIAMDNLYERAKLSLTELLKTLIKLPPELQTAVLGRAYSMDSSVIQEKTESLLIDFDDTDYHYNMEDNRDALLEVIRRTWEEFEISES